MQGKNSAPQGAERKKVDRQAILNSFRSKHVKTVDLTDFLAKFPEIFSISVFEPELIKPYDLDPNEAMATPTSTTQTKKPAPVINLAKPRLVIPKSPFSSSGFTEDLALRVWYYIDEQDNVQGPFTSLEMDNWFDQGYFFNELLIRFKSNNQFYKLIELFGKIATSSLPNTAAVIDKQPQKENQAGNLNVEKSGTKDSKEEAKPELIEVLKQIHSSAQEAAGQYEMQQTAQKTGAKKNSRRTTVEEAQPMMQKNIWENFVDKNKGSDHKSDTSLNDGKQISPSKPDDFSAQDDTFSTKSDSKPDTRTSDLSGDSGANTPNKLNGKVKTGKTDSDNSTSKKGGDDTKNQKGQNSQQHNKKNQREHVEYRPKDEPKQPNKEEKEEQKGNSNKSKKAKGDPKAESQKKDEEVKQKEAKHDTKPPKKKGNNKSKDFQSENWVDESPKKESTPTNQHEQNRGGKKENAGNRTEQSDGGAQNQNGKKQPQGRHEKRQSQSKYVVIFEPKSGSSPEQEKSNVKIQAENDKPAIKEMLIADKQTSHDTEPINKLINTEMVQQEESADYISLLGSVELTKKDPNFTSDIGRPFLPRPVKESRFSHIFRENSGK